MNKFLILFILMLNVIMISNAQSVQNDSLKIDDKLITAIGYVESGHNEKIVSKNKKYVGYLQISKVCVDECNRLLGHKKYTYADRYDKNKSIEMFYVIQQYHNIDNDPYLAMRIWSEGPGAKHKTHRITKYIKKVIKAYNKLFK